MSKKDAALKLALAAVEEALAEQPAQQQQEPVAYSCTSRIAGARHIAETKNVHS